MIQVTEYIQLKRMTPEDAPDIFRAIDENRDSLRTWLPFVDGTRAIDDTIAFIESTRQTAEQTFIIRYQGDYAGLIALKWIDQANKKTEIGYWLIPALEGKGIMTRCCASLILYAFSGLGLNRILIQVGVGNKRSRRIPERLGFREEGVERDGELLVSGYTDIVRYGLLKREYNEGI